jgi:hypothetical protein
MLSEYNTLPEGSTVVLIICASDGKHLTNLSGDKKAWPCDLTIGKIKSSVRSKPTGHSLILLGLLPVPPKLGNNSLSNSTLRRSESNGATSHPWGTLSEHSGLLSGRRANRMHRRIGTSMLSGVVGLDR